MEVYHLTSTFDLLLGNLHTHCNCVQSNATYTCIQCAVVFLIVGLCLVGGTKFVSPVIVILVHICDNTPLCQFVATCDVKSARRYDTIAAHEI